ncbi:Eukaryotic translation initiation factor 3 subunit F-like [Oopsacas minuta]|uniref:Eukaryotic translation initiation factor 3 subunit F-like n=1 Tax=Oopsacas minuta TaxID=111878 RepID=A0AAV7KKE5_9METZ|nr:Eukaryotic translation initiation factor 3 subunit F-like [Oopsacas minuta]
MDQDLQIHPLALFSMIDSYERKIGTPNSIGILLGNASSASGMRVIQVRSSYSINYQLKDELAVNVNWQLAENWTELHKLTYPNDTIVGWFLVGKSIPYFATIVHEYCHKNVSSNCFMVFLDLSFRTDNIEVKAYRMVSLTGGKIDHPLKIGNVFIPFRHKIRPSPPESLVMSALARMEKPPRKLAAIESPISMLESLSQSVHCVEDIARMLDQIIEYIAAIISHKVEYPDLDFGRDLLKYLSSVPISSDGDNYSQQVSGLVQDLLTVINLSEVAQLQIGLSDSVSNLDPLSY